MSEEVLQTKPEKVKKFHIGQRVSIFFMLLVCITLISIIIAKAMTKSATTKNEKQFIEGIKAQKEYFQYIVNSHYGNLEGLEEAKDSAETIASSISGRVLLVDTNFKVVIDTYSKDNGTYIVDKDIYAVMSGYKEEVTYTIRDQYQYIFPIINKEGYIDAVAVFAADRSDLQLANKSLIDRAHIINILFFIIGAIIAYLTATVSVLDIKAIKKKLVSYEEENQETISDDGLFSESKGLVEEINKEFTRAKLLEESRQEFVSNVSHELKTPITSMKVLSESILMQENAPVEMYREFMDDIVQEIDREAQIISDLLTLVKADKGPESMNFESVDMNELMEVILKRLKPLAEKRSIEITFESFREVVADIDKVKFTLAVSNLIENGIKYNVDGGWIKVSLNADHKNVFIKVADSGVGIPEDCVDHIFERFYRVDKARSRDTGGTGLGLAISKSIIVMHKGTVNVYSEPGKGTTFTVKVPMNNNVVS